MAAETNLSIFARNLRRNYYTNTSARSGNKPYHFCNSGFTTVKRKLLSILLFT